MDGDFSSTGYCILEVIWYRWEGRSKVWWHDCEQNKNSRQYCL